MNNDYIKGRGTQIHTTNSFQNQRLAFEFVEGLDEEFHQDKIKTKFFSEKSNKIVNKVNSPDLGFMYSANPYQGCEHGCIYCYARNSHEYWGFNSGLDFESKIIIKKEAPRLLERYLQRQNVKISPIVFSGNTDCYQPVERKMKLTRKCLELLLKYRHPVSIITKNTLIERDKDVLEELAKYNLVHVILSITTLDEKLRLLMEPRTSSAQKKMKVISSFSDSGIPVMVMAAPIIPGLNHHEIPAILKASSEAGARYASYTILRLNGAISYIFKDWLLKNFPDKYHKVVSQTESMHGGELNDSMFYRRMKGEGEIADSIMQLFKVSKKKYFKDRSMPPLNIHSFLKGGNYSLF